VVMVWGALLAAGAAFVLMTAVLSGFGGIYGVLLPLFLVVCSLGLVSTNAMAGALSIDPTRTGSVSAMVGTMQFLFAALVAWATGVVSSQPALALAIVVLVCALGAMIYPLALHRRHRHGT